MRMKQRLSATWKVMGLCLLSVLLISVGFTGVQYLARDTSPVPEQIRTDITFSPFLLSKKSKNYTASDYKFDTAEDKVQILSYVLRDTAGTSITVSEYAQPPEFTEIPEFKDRFLTNVAQQYATVQTSNGTIYLGRLVKQDNKQLAVMIERGLLVFMSPSKELDQAAWRNLGDQLEIQKIIN